jgi:hypothetical protein
MRLNIQPQSVGDDGKSMPVSLSLRISFPAPGINVESGMTPVAYEDTVLRIYIRQTGKCSGASMT